MNNGDIWDLINLVIRKEKEGGSIKVEQIGNLLTWASEEFKLALYRKYEEDQEETDSIRAVKETEIIYVDVDGLYLLSGLSETYWHHSSAYYTLNGNVRRIEPVTDKEYVERMESDLLQPTAERPIMLYLSNHILFEPLRATPSEPLLVPVQYSYLRLPATPVYDYFRDSDDKIRYLESTWSIAENGANYDVHNALGGGGSAIYSDVTHLTAQVFPYNSLSEELDWIDEDKIYIIYLILQKLGVKIELPAVLQYSLLKEQNKVA